MISETFLGIKNTVKSFFNFLKLLPAHIKNLIANGRNELTSLRLKLNNISESNLKLGVSHLENGNYNDAIFRFKLVEKYFDPNNKEACYWLGMTYLLKNNYKDSIIYLQKAVDIDKINLLQFVQSIDNTIKIPVEIYIQLRDVTSGKFLKKYIEKFIDNNNNIPKMLISELNKNITSLPQNYNILDLGSNFGLLAYEIHKRMPDNFELTGIEVSPMTCKYEYKLYNKSLKSFHKSLGTIFPHEYLSHDAQKYDIICSLNGFSTQLDLRDILHTIYLKLNEGGYFAFSIDTAPENHFSKKSLEFSYNIDYLNNLLKETGFNVLSTIEFNVEKNNNCSIFVCMKQLKSE